MLTDAEIAGYMGWRGPGAHTERAMRKVKAAMLEAVAREREACAKLCDEITLGDIGSDSYWYDKGTIACAEAIRERSNDGHSKSGLGLSKKIGRNTNVP